MMPASLGWLGHAEHSDRVGGAAAAGWLGVGGAAIGSITVSNRCRSAMKYSPFVVLSQLVAADLLVYKHDESVVDRRGSRRAALTYQGAGKVSQAVPSFTPPT
jgi:hypothetical protein